MEMVPVESSNVEAAGYDPETREFRARFKKSGATYAYDGVPNEVYDGFLAAESKGRFLGAEIKGKYPHRKLDGGGA